MEGIIEADPFTTTQEDAEELNIDYSVLDIWSKLGRWKSSVSGCLMSWSNIKKIFILKCHPLILHNYESFLDQIVMCNDKWVYKTPRDKLRVWAEKKLQSISQSQTCTNKMSWLLFGGLLLVWSARAFWILVKTLHVRCMLSKLMRCTKNRNVCSQHWPTAWAWCISTTTPNTYCTTNISQVEQSM